MLGGEGARGIGIGEGGQEFSQAGRIGLPPGPAETRTAAHQSPAEENFAEAHLVLADHRQHVFRK